MWSGTFGWSGLTGMSRLRKIWVVVGLLSTTSTVALAGPPAQLMGKSVVISWSETRSQRDGDDPRVRTVDGRHTLMIYVSTAGRAFSRQINTTKLGSGTMDQAPGQSGGTYATRVPSFDGQSMTIIAENRGGARRTVVRFDGSFSSCSATTGTGFQAGKSSVSISPITKKRVEVLSVSVGGVSCSVQSGNVLGGGG